MAEKFKSSKFDDIEGMMFVFIMFDARFTL